MNSRELKSATSVDPEDREEALDLAIGQLYHNLQTVRDHFGMDEKKAAAS
jgi:hypothetical protein